MVVLFTVPLLAHAGVKLDFKPLTKYIAARHQHEQGVDTSQIQAAVQSLSTSVDMNQAAASALPAAGASKDNSAQMAAILANLNELTKQQQAQNQTH